MSRKSQGLVSLSMNVRPEVKARLEARAEEEGHRYPTVYGAMLLERAVMGGHGGGGPTQAKPGSGTVYPGGVTEDELFKLRDDLALLSTVDILDDQEREDRCRRGARLLARMLGLSVEE